MHENPLKLQSRQISKTMRLLYLAGSACGLAGCALAPHQEQPLETFSRWDAPSVTLGAQNANDLVVHSNTENWWTELQDPAINALVEATLGSSPDLAQAMARIQEAQASLGEARSADLPQIAGSLSATRGSSQTATSSSRTQVGSAGNAGLTIGWEIDLFGRLRAQRLAAQQRLNARNIDAQGMRVALAAQVADRTVEWRSCSYLSEVQQWEVSSQEATLALVRQRVSSGISAPIDGFRATNDVEQARTNALAQQELCGRTLNALVALSGLEPDEVRKALSQPPLSGTRACRIERFESSGRCDLLEDSGTSVVVAAPPRIGLAVPAVVLAENPSVVSAQRELAAAHADLDAARASRYPSLNLATLLTGQWLRFGGQALDFATWSAGAVLSAPLLDGGAATANIDGAEARYREALARTIAILRSSEQDIENALLATTSAERRCETTQRAATAAATSTRIVQLQWQAGATTLLDLEDSRRQYAVAVQSAITAARDRSQSWIAVVRATGNRGITTPGLSPKEPNHVE